MAEHDKELAGQVALVTGAGTGLGRRFAVTLAAAGAAVAVCGRRLEPLAAVVEEIEGAGGRALAVALDVRDPAAIVAAVDLVEAELGPVTILVNNAGIPDARRAHKMPLELVDAVIETNLRGPWLLATEVGRRLIAAGTPGRIVNVSSMSGYHTAGGAAALYSVTKAGLNRMTEALAIEWARYPINVNGIAPGTFSSEMVDGLIERVGEIHEGFPASAWATRRSWTARCAIWSPRPPRWSPGPSSRSTTARCPADPANLQSERANLQSERANLQDGSVEQALRGLGQDLGDLLGIAARGDADHGAEEHHRQHP
ncbi:SDR family NAD(P)-dependent oxidoreductase [Nocardioides alcanivorans]|uniref:SDR family NAD(P)-dependent oxidoreductase n=1 Tax=Nocardioides alcanivorans TaxID=2897352 RepID=UPI001F3F78A1|nr:SDR family oxidoreductase [Nocardioides alcanivorans]